MDVKISGTVLSSLFFEHGNSDCDLDGFLLGKVGNHVTETISDLHIKKSTETTSCYVYSYVLCRQPCQWYDSVGRIQEEELIKLLNHGKQREVVGWFKFRRNSSLNPSLREQSIHCHLQDCFPGLLPENLLYLLCTPRTAHNKATHDMDHVFQVKRGRMFEALPVTVVNLGDTVNSTYKFAGSSTVSTMEGHLTHVLDNLSADFVCEDGQLRSVASVKHLGTTLQRQLQDISGSVKDSERELKKLRQDIRVLKARLKPKPEKLPSSSTDSSKYSWLDEGPLHNVLSRSFEGSSSSTNPFSPVFPPAAGSSQSKQQQFTVSRNILTNYPKDKNSFVQAEASKNPFVPSGSTLAPPEIDLITLQDSDEEALGPKKGQIPSGQDLPSNTSKRSTATYSQEPASRLDLGIQLHGPEVRPVLQPQRSVDSDKSSSSSKLTGDAFDFVADLMTVQQPAKAQRTTRAQNTGRNAQAQKYPVSDNQTSSRRSAGVAEAIEMSSSDDDHNMEYEFSNSQTY